MIQKNEWHDKWYFICMKCAQRKISSYYDTEADAEKMYQQHLKLKHS